MGNGLVSSSSKVPALPILTLKPPGTSTPSPPNIQRISVYPRKTPSFYGYKGSQTIYFDNIFSDVVVFLKIWFMPNTRLLTWVFRKIFMVIYASQIETYHY